MSIINSTIDFSPATTIPYAQATDVGLLISDGWTVAIPKETAVEYVQHYNKRTNHGFFELNDKICLSHGAAKLMLTHEEANALVALIRAAYLGE